MKKKVITLLSAVSIVLLSFLYIHAGSGRESTMLPPQEVEIMYSTEDHAYQMKDLSDVVRWKVFPDGQVAQYDSSGVTQYVSPSSKYVYITSYTQLSSWGAGGVAGSSYFNLSPGKHYLIDPHAIWLSGKNPAGSTGFAQATVLSGISAVMFNAETYSGITNAVRITYITTTDDVSFNATSGATSIQVWPYAGSATTLYGHGKSAPQTLFRQYVYTDGIITGTSWWTGTSGYAAGASHWEINRPGESATYIPCRGGISVIVTDRNYF